MKGNVSIKRTECEQLVVSKNLMKGGEWKVSKKYENNNSNDVGLKII